MRSAAVRLSGHGIRSAVRTEIPQAVAEIFAAAAGGALQVDVVTHPLSEVGAVWDIPERLVLIP